MGIEFWSSLNAPAILITGWHTELSDITICQISMHTLILPGYARVQIKCTYCALNGKKSRTKIKGICEWKAELHLTSLHKIAVHITHSGWGMQPTSFKGLRSTGLDSCRSEGTTLGFNTGQFSPLYKNSIVWLFRSQNIYALYFIK